MLLLGTVSAVIGFIIIVHSNSPSRNRPEATTEMTSVSVPTCVLKCVDNWELHGGKCYYLSPESIELNWNNSRDICRRLRADLVKIESREEQKFILNKLQLNDWFWIGLSDSETEGQWKWMDGSPLDQSLSFWSQEPDDWKGSNNEFSDGEDCAVIRFQDRYLEDRMWADVYCGHLKRFIYEKEPSYKCK